MAVSSTLTITYSKHSILSNLSNQTCTGREILCQNRQDVGLHSVKHAQQRSMGMKINVGYYRETVYTEVN